MEMCPGVPDSRGGHLIFSLEFRGGPLIFSLKFRGGPLIFSLEFRGGVHGFFPRRVAKCLILETYNSYSITFRRLNRCLNTLKMHIVCIFGVLGSLLFLEMAFHS